MATVINNPTPVNPVPVETRDNGSGLVLGIILLLLLVALFFYFGLFRGFGAGYNTGSALRNNGTSGTQINVPKRVDVNVNK